MQADLLIGGIKYVLAALAGGGLWKVLDYWFQARGQQHQHRVEDSAVARQLRDELRQDMDEMRKRIETLERQVEIEREARLRAELGNTLLQTKVDLLIRMVNDLRAKEGLQPITSDEILPITLPTLTEPAATSGGIADA